MTRHVYLHIRDGICEAMTLDMADAATAEAVAETIVGGGHVERVSATLVRWRMLGQPWPPIAEAITVRELVLRAQVAAAGQVA